MSWNTVRLKEGWFWLTEKEIIERLDMLERRGRMAKATAEEIARIDNGDWQRVGTYTICKMCGKEYADHPLLDYDPILHRLCNGTLGKT